MSRKNHEMIDGKLLQTDKKYSQLKLKQKEKIADWMFQATRDYYTKKYVFPNEKHLEEMVNSVCEKQQQRKFGFHMVKYLSTTDQNVQI